MRQISIVLFLQAVSMAGAQLMSGSITLGGVHVTYKSRLEPDTPGVVRSGSGTLTENSVAKRHFCDFEDRKCFGYDLRAEMLEGGSYRLTFSPLTISPEKMAEIFKEVKDWTIVPFAQKTVIETVRGGETVALDLFVNPSTGQKIVDYLTVQNRNDRELTATGNTRDFTLDDIWLELSGPRLTINGKAFEATQHMDSTISGPSMWVYIARRGRFLFSLVPHSELGFQKAGEIRGSTMKWRWLDDEFLIDTERRIAPGDAAFNLYVFHDPAFRIKGNDDFVMGSGGKLENLVRR
jgi:hypothetical protein